MARALGLAMTGDKLSAEEAEKWGLIWEAMDDPLLPEQAMALATHLSAQPARPGGDQAGHARQRDQHLRCPTRPGATCSASSAARLQRGRERLPRKTRARFTGA
jgi:enoyl-CoA hydratase/carnithine racemase